jgi:hypothetical protein
MATTVPAIKAINLRLALLWLYGKGRNSSLGQLPAGTPDYRPKGDVGFRSRKRNRRDLRRCSKLDRQHCCKRGHQRKGNLRFSDVLMAGKHPKIDISQIWREPVYEQLRTDRYQSERDHRIRDGDGHRRVQIDLKPLAPAQKQP